MTYEHDTSSSGAIDMHMAVPSPGSPPGMISSKSSKTSSLRSSLASDDGVVVADVSHFEEIGLEDDSITVDAAHSRDFNQLKSDPNPYSASFTAQLRRQSIKHVGPAIHHGRPARSTSNAAEEPARPPIQRSITAGPKVRPSVPALKTQFRDTSTQNLTSLGPQHHTGPLPIRGLVVRSASSASANRRPRSPSPGLSPSALSSRDVRRPGMPVRRSSWQSTREPKSTVDLEKECDDDDDDDIPEGVFLDNVPISPRPMDERPPSRAMSMSSSASPERRTKERVRSVGNGTPAVSVEQGSLRSPSWKSEASSGDSIKSPGFSPSPTKGRAKSWNAALSALSAEARALTEKLEEHADEEDKHGIRGGAVARPVPKPRVKSALAELPPLRRTNIMIDPLPISKEKEAVLSRTRPSWLPPKDPAEEKKHLKEYQRMMASSIESDKRREAARKEKEKNKDAMAENLIEMWEENVLKRWPEAVRERKTRELWWKGVAPRCRGTVWTKAIGNELGLTETSYNAALARAKEIESRVSKGQASTEDERRMAWMEQMKRDVEEKTWVELKIFQSGGPLHQPLLDVLSAYAMYRSDIGYVSGCNTIAATLLLNLPSATTSFVALANLLNRALPLSFLAADQGAKSSAYNLVMSTLLSKAPRLHSHLTSSKLSIDFEDYLGRFFSALFTRDLCLDECTRLWDVYVFEGDSVLVRAAVALLLEREGSLLAAQSREEVLKVFAQGIQKTVAGRENEWMVKVRAAGKA